MTKSISRVRRSKAQAQRAYDRMSRWYDLIAGSSEWPFVLDGLELLQPRPNERILDLGCGTGRAIEQLMTCLQETGQAVGLDLSRGMLHAARKRNLDPRQPNPPDFVLGDGASLPFSNQSFDALFMSFTLELFDTPDIPRVLQECRRVLRPHGRIIVVAMAQIDPKPLIVRIYEWTHKRFPQFIDCRPIYAAHSLQTAGFELEQTAHTLMWGLPVDLLRARMPA